MGQKNIVFIGFMGSGKTLVSKELEKILSRKRVSTDDLIVEREGISIAEIFARKGEAYFRSLEKEIIKQVSSELDLIIDCGGGVVLNPENIRLLKENGVLINLKITAESVLKNIKDNTARPLLNVADPKAKIEALLKERSPLYEQADYFVVADNKSVLQITQEVIKVLENV